MTESHMTGAPADGWPTPVLLLDARMGYMHALQGWIYEVATLGMHGRLGGYSLDKLAALVERAQENFETWENLHQVVWTTLVAIASEDKARSWEATAKRVHGDLQRCIDGLHAEMRGM